MRNGIVLSQRGEQRLIDTVRKVNAVLPARRSPRHARTPIPRLAKPAVPVGANTQGDFDLQGGTPGGLTSTGVVQQAYALVDIEANETVELVWIASRATNGYWLAKPTEVATTTTTPAEPDDCICDLIDWIKEYQNPSTEALTALNQLSVACGCSPDVSGNECSRCSNGTMPAQIAVEISGVAQLPHNNDPFRWNFDDFDLAGVINTTHTLDMVCAGGTKRIIVEAKDSAGNVNQFELYLFLSMSETFNAVDRWGLLVSIQTAPDPQINAFISENRNADCAATYVNFYEDNNAHNPFNAGYRYVDYSQIVITVRPVI